MYSIVNTILFPKKDRADELRSYILDDLLGSSNDWGEDAYKIIQSYGIIDQKILVEIALEAVEKKIN